MITFTRSISVSTSSLGFVGVLFFVGDDITWFVSSLDVLCLKNENLRRGFNLWINEGCFLRVGVDGDAIVLFMELQTSYESDGVVVIDIGCYILAADGRASTLLSSSAIND